jgi:hypothetical protein
LIGTLDLTQSHGTFYAAQFGAAFNLRNYSPVGRTTSNGAFLVMKSSQLGLGRDATSSWLARLMTVGRAG